MGRFRTGAVAAAALAIACRAPASATPLSLDVRDLDIYDAVRLLSTQAAVNVVVDSSVQHKPVTLRLRDVTFDQALTTLARANDLQTAHIGNVIYLGTADAINRRYVSSQSAGVRTAVFALHNGGTDEISKSLTLALPTGTLVVPDTRTSSVIVTGPAAVVERATSLVGDLDQPSGVQSATIPMRYVKAAETVKALTATLQIQAPASAYASEQQNAVVLTGSRDFLVRAGALAARIDRPGQQVRYEVRVTDISPSETANVGFLYGGIDASGTQQPGSASTVTTFMRNSLGVNATINALEVRGLAKILARPTISTLNNVQASLLVGEQYPVVYFDPRTFSQQVQFVNVGVNLIVTPTIGADGAITTELETGLQSSYRYGLDVSDHRDAEGAVDPSASATARRSSSPDSFPTSTPPR